MSSSYSSLFPPSPPAPLPPAGEDDNGTYHPLTIPGVSQGAGIPENVGEGLIIFGSGIYRKSLVFLAYQPASEIEDSESIRYLTEVMQKALRYGTSAPGLLAGVIPPKECLWLDRRTGDFPRRSGGISSAL